MLRPTSGRRALKRTLGQVALTSIVGLALYGALRAPSATLQEWVALGLRQVRLTVLAAYSEGALLAQITENSDRIALENAALRAENRSLQALLRSLDLSAPLAEPRQLARVIRREGGLSGALRINRGEDDGLRRQAAVLTREGLLGLINYVGPSWAEVVPLNARGVAIDGVLAHSGRHAIFTGDGEATRSSDVPQTEPVQIGELVYASGEGDVAPPGTVIGHVASLQPAHQPGFWRVSLRLNATPAIAEAVQIVSAQAP